MVDVCEIQPQFILPRQPLRLYSLFNPPLWDYGKGVPLEAIIILKKYLKSCRTGDECVNILESFFLEVMEKNIKDILPAVILCSGKMDTKMLIGEQVIDNLLSFITNIPNNETRNKVRKTGNVGEFHHEHIEVSSDRKRKTRHGYEHEYYYGPIITVTEVYNELKNAASLSGRGSKRKKEMMLKTLLNQCSKEECIYIIDFLRGKKNIRTSTRIIILALSRAYTRYICKKREPFEFEMICAHDIILKGYNNIGRWDLFIDILFRYELKYLAYEMSMRINIPVKLMSFTDISSLDQINNDFSDRKWMCQQWYRGKRIQIHMCRSSKKNTEGIIQYFTERAENVTNEYSIYTPSIISCIQSDIKNIILDVEVCFENKKEPRFIIVDILLYNDISVHSLTLEDRNAILEKCLMEKKSPILRIPSYSIIIEPSLLMKDERYKNGCILRLYDHPLNSLYHSNTKNEYWFRYKKQKVKDIETCVVTPIGAWYGRGRNAGMFSSFLLACYNEESGIFEVVCKMGGNISFENIKYMTSYINDNTLTEPRDDYLFNDQCRPDIWFSPHFLFDVSYESIVQTNNHPCLDGHILRFPILQNIVKCEDGEKEIIKKITKSSELLKKIKKNP